MIKTVKKLFILALMFGGLLFLPNIVQAEVYGAGNPVNIYFFHSLSCPHCRAEEPYLKTLEEKYENITLQEFEISENPDNIDLLQKVAKEMHANFMGVPVTIVGTEYISGWDDAKTTGRELDAMIDRFAGKKYYNDPVKNILNATAEENIAQENIVKNPNAPDKQMHLPVLGDINLKDISLPFLAVALGFVDGFNPCAMWVLVFLIGLLLGMKDRKKMWFLGALFIFISALSYFVFMAAWLNLFIFIGVVFWVRLGIGLLALVFGFLNLKDFFSKKPDECKISDFAERKNLTEKMREVVLQNKFWLSVLGIIGLGFSINLVELLCSAGFPAVFTEVLTLSGLHGASYYGYILLYILFYMIDDLVVFFIAMITLKATGLSTKYLKASKLIGGALMLIIGLLMVFKPEWLMWG